MRVAETEASFVFKQTRWCKSGKIWRFACFRTFQPVDMLEGTPTYSLVDQFFQSLLQVDPEPIVLTGTPTWRMDGYVVNQPCSP